MTGGDEAGGLKVDTPTVCPICGDEFPGWKSGNVHKRCLRCDLAAMKGDHIMCNGGLCSAAKPETKQHVGLRQPEDLGPPIPPADRHQLQLMPRREIRPPGTRFCPYPTHGMSRLVPRGEPPVYKIGPAPCPERDREVSDHAPGSWCETCWAAWFWGSEPWKLAVSDVRRYLREGRGLPPYGCEGAERHDQRGPRDAVVADCLREGYSRAEIAHRLGLHRSSLDRYIYSRPLLANLEFILRQTRENPRFAPPIYEGRTKTRHGWRDRSILATDLADRVSRGTAYPELIDAAASLGLPTYDDEES